MSSSPNESAIAVALAFLVVIREGDLLLPLLLPFWLSSRRGSAVAVAVAFALALLVVIPEGDLLLPLLLPSLLLLSSCPVFEVININHPAAQWRDLLFLRVSTHATGCDHVA
ncbi:MAG TPA: hypothetical protein VGG81_00090 [Edaphobacter sp.]